jgi:hypothetical protein
MITKLFAGAAILAFAAPTFAADPATVPAEVNSQITDAVPATPATHGLRGSYAGAGVAIGVNGQGAAPSVIGRLDLRELDVKAPLSFRPQVTFSDYSEAALGLTYDFAVGEKINVYVGGGVAFRESGPSYWGWRPERGILTRRDATVGYVQGGVEKEIAENVVLFGDLKYGLGNGSTLVPTVGAAWRF